MKDIIKKIFTLLFLLLLLILFFINFNELKTNMINTIELIKNNILTTLLPIMIISDLLIEYGLVEILCIIFNKIFSSIFGLSGYNSYIFFLSLFTGCPSNAIYTKNLLNKNYISFNEANRIIKFTSLNNPLFLFSMLISLFDYKITLKIIIINYLSNFILGILLRKKSNYKINNKELLNNVLNKKIYFFNILTKSIKNNIKNIINISFFILIFNIISSLISIYFNNIYINRFLIGLLEITNGLNELKNMPYCIKLIYSVVFISFGGLSIHMQIKSIINDTLINYKSYLLSKILLVIISLILALIII